MANTFETGATTAAANNLVLSVINDGGVYQDRLHCAWAELQGKSHRLSFRDLANNEAIKQRTQGCKFKPQEITEAGKIIRKETINGCLEMLRDDWNGENIAVIVRRWFDKANGNSYWAAKVSIPTNGGIWRQLVIPFQYGYGNQPEHDCCKVLEKLGFFKLSDVDYIRELPIEFEDQGYMNKNRLFDGNYYI